MYRHRYIDEGGKESVLGWRFVCFAFIFWTALLASIIFPNWYVPPTYDEVGEKAKGGKPPNFKKQEKKNDCPLSASPSLRFGSLHLNASESRLGALAVETKPACQSWIAIRELMPHVAGTVGPLQFSSPSLLLCISAPRITSTLPSLYIYLYLRTLVLAYIDRYLYILII